VWLSGSLRLPAISPVLPVESATMLTLLVEQSFLSALKMDDFENG